MSSIQTLEKKYQALPYPDFTALITLAIKKPKEYIFAHPEYCLSLVQKLRFFYLLHRYTQGYSIAVLRGTKEFFGVDFIVNKHTLIPRPDTEIMVEAVVKKIKTLQGTILLIDIGTGTGCIPISIIKTSKHENMKTIATDISAQALRVAQKNAIIHGVAMQFLKGNLLEPVLKNRTMEECNDRTIVITANLPYLNHEQFMQEKSIQREPYTALVAAENGLALYRELLEQVTTKLLPNYRNELDLFFEIDPSQSNAIIKLIKKYLPEASISIIKDLGGRNRVAEITMPTRT